MVDDKGTLNATCPSCEKRVSDIELHTCPMCRSLFCQHCGVMGYGREFCGVPCRDMFFFGDGDETEEDY